MNQNNIEIQVNERPRICCIDIKSQTIKELKNIGFNIYSGTLGSKIKVPNKTHNHSHNLLLNYDFPANLHEFDLVILDLQNSEIVNYKVDEHTLYNHSGKTAVSLISSYPETIFDPRPLTSIILNNRLSQIGNRKHIIIAFTVESYNIEYETVEISENRYQRQNTEKHNIYDFAGNIELAETKWGREMHTCNVREDLRKLLEEHRFSTTYNQTFYHPTIWEDNITKLDPRFIPLMKNSSGDIVSFYENRDNSIIFLFPQIENKLNFITTFLTKIAPDLIPELFPYSTTFAWKNDMLYWLPNHKTLLNEKEATEIEFRKTIESIENKISSNITSFSFLYGL